jgi:hypothetical protein
MSAGDDKLFSVSETVEGCWHGSNPAAVCPAVKRYFKKSVTFHASGTRGTRLVSTIVEGIGFDIWLIVMNTKTINSFLEERDVEVRCVPILEILDKFLPIAERTWAACKSSGCCLGAIFSHDL